jgi:hypothetical protein
MDSVSRDLRDALAEYHGSFNGGDAQFSARAATSYNLWGLSR